MIPSPRYSTLLAITIAVAGVGFSTPALAADIEKGKAVYAQRCAMCHGEKGAGDGVAAAGFPEGQKPRNLAGGGNKYATDDAKLREVIKKGGAAVGLSALMPAQSDIKDEDLNSLVVFVNSLKK